MELAANASSRLGRPNYSLEFRKQIAQAAMVPGVSVSALAREHGLNVNMVFTWRRRYCAGHFDRSETGAHQNVLLPVSVAPSPVEGAASKQPRAALADGMIEVTFDDAVVRVQGQPDVDTLQAVLRSLRP